MSLKASAWRALNAFLLAAGLCSTATAGQQPSHAGWPQPVHNNQNLSYLLVDQLELRSGAGTPGLRWDVQGWYGNNMNKFWYKTEGETAGSLTEEAEFQALYDRPISPYFDLQAGLRGDLKPVPSRTWAALGVQGLAPYYFDVEATAFVSDAGHLAARFLGGYSWLLTQRLSLRPEVELNIYSKSQPQRGIGAGLSDLDAGLRLQYQIRREFAPYVGVAYERRYGATAAYARTASEPVHQLRLVAGVRAWF